MGDKFRSKSEATWIKELEKSLPGLKRTYEKETFNWTDDTVHEYTPDVKLGTRRDNGKPVYLELKGVPSMAEIVKIRNVLRCNPHIEVWVLIYSDSRVYASKKKLWSEKFIENGITTVVGVLPKTYLQLLNEYDETAQDMVRPSFRPTQNFRTYAKTPSIKRNV